MTDTTSFGLGPIGQIQLRVHDLDRATTFYRDALGVRFLFRVPNMAFFDCGGVRLMLGIPESPTSDHPGSVIYFKVGDINAAHRTLLDRGVRFEGEPHLIAKMPDHDLWMAFFYDADDNMLALMCEMTRA